MKTRDRRTKRRFFVDNAIIRVYGNILGPIGIAVYSALVMHADIDDQTCFPAHKTIAREIGASESSVIRKLKLLRDQELITWKRRPHPANNNGQISNLYTLLKLPTLAPTSSPPDPPGVRQTPGLVSEDHQTGVTGTDEQSPSDNPQKEQSPIAPAAQTPTALPEKRSKDQERKKEQRTDKIATRKVGSLTVPATSIITYRDYGLGHKMVVYPEGHEEVEVAEIWLEPDDTQLSCPYCDHTQPWPQSENQRRNTTALMCQVGEGKPMDGCGAYFIVHGWKSSGRKFTYKLRIPEPSWAVVVDGIKFTTTEDEARLFLSNWDEDHKFLLQKLDWATDPETGMVRVWKRDDVIIQRVNAAYATGMKKRAGRQAEKDRPAEPTEVLVDPETGQTYVEEGRY